MSTGITRHREDLNELWKNLRPRCKQNIQGGVMDTDLEAVQWWDEEEHFSL